MLTKANLFILQNGRMITHPANEEIYAGTGRAHLLSLCKEKEIPTEERVFTLEELMSADEVILTSASALCMRIVEIDGKPVGGKASYTLKALQDALLEDYLSKTE